MLSNDFYTSVFFGNVVTIRRCVTPLDFYRIVFNQTIYFKLLGRWPIVLGTWYRVALGYFS